MKVSSRFVRLLALAGVFFSLAAAPAHADPPPSSPATPTPPLVQAVEDAAESGIAIAAGTATSLPSNCRRVGPTTDYYDYNPVSGEYIPQYHSASFTVTVTYCWNSNEIVTSVTPAVNGTIYPPPWGLGWSYNGCECIAFAGRDDAPYANPACAYWNLSGVFALEGVNVWYPNQSAVDCI